MLTRQRSAESSRIGARGAVARELRHLIDSIHDFAETVTGADCFDALTPRECEAIRRKLNDAVANIRVISE